MLQAHACAWDMKCSTLVLPNSIAKSAAKHLYAQELLMCGRGKQQRPVLQLQPSHGKGCIDVSNVCMASGKDRCTVGGLSS